MQKYAILGATGHTGQALLKYFTTLPSTNELHLYARSAAKLLTQNPSFGPSTLPSHIKLFTGGLMDTELIKRCIKEVDTVFVALGVDGNVPGLTLCQDTAHVLCAVMRELKIENGNGNGELPRIVFLSAGPVSAKFKAQMPAFVKWMLWTALGNVYRDLEAAEKILRREKEMEEGGGVGEELKVVFVYAPGISNVEERVLGHKISGEAAEGFIGYPDLARGLVEIAEEKDEGKWDWRDVTVVGTGRGVVIDKWWMLKTLVMGMLYEVVPWLYKWL